MDTLRVADRSIAESEGTPTTIINLTHGDEVPEISDLADSNKPKHNDHHDPAADGRNHRVLENDKNAASIPILTIDTEAAKHKALGREQKKEQKKEAKEVSAASSVSAATSASLAPTATTGPQAIIAKFTGATTKEKLIMVWRIFDQNVMYIRPIVLPLIAFVLGWLHFNLLFPLILAGIWVLAMHNGHLLPRPPAETDTITTATGSATGSGTASGNATPPQQLDPSIISPISSPESAASLSADLSLAAFHAHAAQSAGAVGMMSLPALLAGLTVQYPDWVFYPDVQRTKWINDILFMLWPYAKAAVKGQIDKQIAPILAKTKGYVHITSLDFGTDPPFVGGIKVYDTKDEHVMMDIDIRLALEPKIRIEGRYKQWICLPVEVTAVTGIITARVALSDMCGKFPCFRRLGISLAKKPILQTTVKVCGLNIFAIPILGSFGQHFIEDMTNTLFGWPKELSIPIMVETADEAAARNKLEPKGLLHIYLMSASNLKNVELTGYVGIGKSDPYCKLTLGDQTMTSQVIDNNLNPIWNADYEFIVYEPETEKLLIRVYDSDVVSVPNPLSSKKLGDIEFAVNSLLIEPFQDVSLPLQNTTQGNIRFQCEWRPFAPRSNKRHHHHNTTGGESNTASNSVLFVSNLRAYDLPLDNCYLKFAVGNTKKKTASVVERGREMEWEERFSFPVYNTDLETVVIELRYADLAGKLTGFATKNLTLGMKEMQTKSRLLSTITVDVREVARMGHLTDDFSIPLPPGMKSNGRPKLHVSFLLRELEASVASKQRLMAATRRAIPGTLNFTLLSASNLIGVDHHGTLSDPYCIVTVGTEHFKSKTIKKNCNPQWNEKYTFQISDILRDELQMDFRDWSGIGSIPIAGGIMGGIANRVTMKSDQLGDVHVPLRVFYAELYTQEPFIKELPLEHTTKGVCKISLQFEPIEGIELPLPETLMIGNQMDLKRFNTLSSINPSTTTSGTGSAGNTPTGKLRSIQDSKEDDDATTRTSGNAVAPRVKANLNTASMGVATSMQDPNNPNATTTNGVPTADHAGSSAGSSGPQTPLHVRTGSGQIDSASSTPGTISPPQHGRHLSDSLNSTYYSSENNMIHHDIKTLEGYLVVTIHNATNLRLPSAKDIKDTNMIPTYVKLSLGRNKLHTKVVKSGDSPIWEETLKLPIHSHEFVQPQNTLLKIRIKRDATKRLFSANETIGDVDLSLLQLIQTPNNNNSNPLEINVNHQPFSIMDPKNNNIVGNIIISCNFEAKGVTNSSTHHSHNNSMTSSSMPTIA